MREAALLLNAMSEMASADSSAMQLIIKQIRQEFPGSHSQAVSANEAEVIIGKIIDAHLTSHPQAPVTRSRKSYAVHECRKRLATCGHVNPRRLIALALLLCPGEASVKHEIMLVIMPPAEEVAALPTCIPEAVAALTTIQPDVCVAAQGVVTVRAVCSGNSAMLPKLFHPDRVSSLTSLFGGILANGVSTVGHEKLTVDTIAKVVAAVRDSMLELVTATATHMETQHGGGPAPRLRGPNAERQLLKHGSAGSNVIRMPSFGTSLASVDLEEDASQNATSDGDSALLQVMQKYTRDTSALKFLLEQLDTSAKGSRGSTTDFLDSSSKIFSASNSQSNASAANAQLKSATTEGSDQPQASHDTAQGAGGEPHHYTPRDALSPSYPPEEPGSASSVNAAHMSRLETHSADTDPSRTGATDMSLHNESFNLSTAKIRLHQQATPSGARNSQVDGIRRSGHTVSAAEPAAPGPVHAVKSGVARPLVPGGSAATSANPVPAAAAAGHFGSHFRGRSLGGEPGGASEASPGVDGWSGHGSRASDPAHASRNSASAQGTRDGHAHSTESMAYGPGMPGLIHAPSAVGSVAVSQAPSTRRNVLEMSAVPRVQQGSPKVHVPYSTSPSDHVHLGDHSRMALAISGTLTASSHPLSNPASSPRSPLNHEGYLPSLPPDAAGAVSALAATGSDVSNLQRTLHKQVSHGHPWGGRAAHGAAGSASGGGADVFAAAGGPWDQASMAGSDTGAVGGTPASHKQPLQVGDGVHGTLPFGTFRRDGSGDELNGVSLRPDGQAIHVTSARDSDEMMPPGTQSTRLSHRMRRMASRVPFVRSQIRQKEVPELTFYSQSVLPSAGDVFATHASPRGGRTVWLGGAHTDADGGRGGTAPLATRGRTLAKSASFAGGKLPVVTSKAMAMATVNRQLMVTAPQDPLGAACKSLTSLNQPAHMASPAGSALLERLLQDTQDQAHGRGSHFSSVSPRAQTPAGSIAASDMSAPAVVMSDTLGGVRSRHSSPPGVVARRSSAAHSAQPSLDGGPAGAGDVTQSQPLPRAPTAQSSLDNVFSLQPGSSPAAGSAPLADRPERAFHHRRHSSVPGPPDGAVSVSVNGGISAKSPDAAAAADVTDFSSGAEDQFGADRRSPTLGPHNLSGHFAASFENLAAELQGSRGASCGSSPASANLPHRTSTSAPPAASRSRKLAGSGGRPRTSDGTSSPPAVPCTPTTAVAGGDNLAMDSDGRSSGPRWRSGTRQHGSNFSFGRSMQDPAVLAAADAVLWPPDDTLGSVDIVHRLRTVSTGHMHDTGGSQAMSVTLARRLDRNVSRSMPARSSLRQPSAPPPARASAGDGDAAAVMGPGLPHEELAVQWDRLAASSRAASGSQIGDTFAHSPSRSRTLSPESPQLTDTLLLPQPPASAGLAPSAPLSASASSSFFQDASGVSFRTAVSGTSSFFQSHSPSADGTAAAAGPPWSHSGSGSMHPQPPRQSTESHGSSAQSVVVHGSGASGLYGRVPRPPAINTPGPYMMPPGQSSTPQEASPVTQMRRSFSGALMEEFAAAHAHTHGPHQLAATSPARSGVTLADDEADERVQELLQHMQLQVDLAANATDNELRVQADRHAAAKAEVDPIRAVTSMAAVLGGKFFLLQGVRLILSVCLLVSSVAGFFALLQYAKLNVALSLTIVVGVNVCLAGVLLLIIILKAPSQSGLGDLLRPSGGGGGSSSLQAVLPTFHPVIKDAFQSIVKQSQEGGGGGGGQSGEGGGGSARTARGGRSAPPPASRVPRRASVTPRGMPLPTIDPSAMQRAASSPDTVAPAAARQPLARNSVMGGQGERPAGVLSRVVDTGNAIMNRLPPKHRESQVGRIARGLLMELRDHSQQNGQTPDSGAVAEGGRSRDDNGSARYARSFAGPAPEIREMPTYEWS